MSITEGDSRVLITGMVKTAGADITQYDAVAFNGDGEIVPAKADSADTMPCVGIAQAAAVEGADVEVVFIGPSLSRPDTTLVPDGSVFVSASEAGKITQTAPSAEGTYQQQIGVSIGASTIMVQIAKSVYRRPS